MMCGIVGYIGTREAYPILIEGLSALEYRGYDSAGIALVDKKGIIIYKDKGKVDHLREITKKVPQTATTGIAHTRWATHGAPSFPMLIRTLTAKNASQWSTMGSLKTM